MKLLDQYQANQGITVWTLPAPSKLVEVQFGESRLFNTLLDSSSFMKTVQTEQIADVIVHTTEGDQMLTRPEIGELLSLTKDK